MKSEDLEKLGQRLRSDEDRRAMIAKRAYELYLTRGSEVGCELDDWLQAEKEVFASLTGANQAHADPASNKSQSREASKADSTRSQKTPGRTKS